MTNYTDSLKFDEVDAGKPIEYRLAGDPNRICILPMSKPFLASEARQQWEDYFPELLLTLKNNDHLYANIDWDEIDNCQIIYRPFEVLLDSFISRAKMGRDVSNLVMMWRGDGTRYITMATMVAARLEAGDVVAKATADELLSHFMTQSGVAGIEAGIMGYCTKFPEYKT